jgi:hypothetical protein
MKKSIPRELAMNLLKIMIKKNLKNRLGEGKTSLTVDIASETMQAR